MHEGLSDVFISNEAIPEAFIAFLTEKFPKNGLMRNLSHLTSEFRPLIAVVKVQNRQFCNDFLAAHVK